MKKRRKMVQLLITVLFGFMMGPSFAGAGNETLTITGPPVAEGLVFAVMETKNMGGVKFIPWQSPDQARALIAGGRVDGAIVTTAGAAAYWAKGAKVKIAGVFQSRFWVVSSLKAIRPDKSLQGTLALPFGHGEMPELIFNILFPETGLTIARTGGPLEAVNRIRLGRADHAILAEPAASIAVAKSVKTGAPDTGQPVLVKYLDIPKVWQAKFTGIPLYVGALAVFNRAAENPDRIREVLAAYETARAWIISHPEEAGAIAGKSAPVLAEFFDRLQPGLGSLDPNDPTRAGYTAGPLVSGPRAFDATLFFLDRIYQSYPWAVGDKAPDRRIFMGAN